MPFRGIAARGGARLPPSSSRAGQSDNPDAVRQRLASAVLTHARETSRAPQAAPIASFASRLSSILQQLRAAAPNAEIIVTGAWNPEPDHSSSSSRSTARSTRPSPSRGGVARSGREHASGVQSARERASPEGPALRAHLHLLEGRSASDRRRVPGDGRCPHGCFGLPAEAVDAAADRATASSNGSAACWVEGEGGREWAGAGLGKEGSGGGGAGGGREVG